MARASAPPTPSRRAAWPENYKGDRPLYRERLKAGLAQLTGHKLVAPGKVAVIGYCFRRHGRAGIGAQRRRLEGRGHLPWRPQHAHAADAKNIKCPVLVLHGADDPLVNSDEVAAFKKEMADAKVKYTFIAYPGAVHAFTRPDVGSDNSKGIAYNAEADKKSWAEMKKFFSQIFS